MFFNLEETEMSIQNEYCETEIEQQKFCFTIKKILIEVKFFATEFVTVGNQN